MLSFRRNRNLPDIGAGIFQTALQAFVFHFRLTAEILFKHHFLRMKVGIVEGNFGVIGVTRGQSGTGFAFLLRPVFRKFADLGNFSADKHIEKAAEV